MIFKILENGSEVNTIVSDWTFVAEYCKENGYTFEAMPDPEPEPTPTQEERIASLEAENHLLNQKVAALTDQNDFQEELIVELANIVYA